MDRRQFLKTAALVSVGASLPVSLSLLNPENSIMASSGTISFEAEGKSRLGRWKVRASLSEGSLYPGQSLTMNQQLLIEKVLLDGLKKEGVNPEKLVLLITSERCFDANGWLHVPSDERMSTLLTPTGLAIEGGDTGAISYYTHSRHRNPVDQMTYIEMNTLTEEADFMVGHCETLLKLAEDIPPGIYRLRVDLGIIFKKHPLSLNNGEFAAREKDSENLSLYYTPPMLCSGPDQNGNYVQAAAIKPRIYWVILSRYNSNGYRGVVADQDRGHFAISDRNIIPDEVILPLYDNYNKIMTYNLEPEFRADSINPQRNIPWNYNSGELSITVTDPSGNTQDLGTAPFAGTNGGMPTTGKSSFLKWKPQGYGRYTVTATGWIEDQWGNKYQGGGTYHFWIAKRLTMATATFQGQSYPVGSRYGRDIGFFPAVPAEAKVEAALYPFSSDEPKTLTYSGKATKTGTFGTVQGMQPFFLDAPGEYYARITATHLDEDGHLWVCSMTHAGVVYSSDSKIIAHGKKVKVNNVLVDRGETHTEGYASDGDDLKHLQHINYPYQAGDALLIASEGQGANKIEPVLTYRLQGDDSPYPNNLQTIGATNIRIATSNGMSPHLYPEYITDLAYYYSSAPRPGFSSRFLVGEDGVRAPYWPVSNTNFGGQIGASNNGDQPGDIYRLLGGVVLRPQKTEGMSAGYMASAFILPKGTNNNRVIAPGSEDLIGADGRKFRFFLVSTRPGMIYEQGASYAPAFQIDPVLPVKIKFSLSYPDGTVKTQEGTGDAFGSCVGSQRWTLDQLGIYVYQVSSSWEGYEGSVPGLPEEGGYLFVKTKETGSSSCLKLNLKNQQVFDVKSGLRIQGASGADAVYYAAVTPGAVVDQGKIPVQDGKFEFYFDPAKVNERIPIYDIVNLRTGKPEIGRIIHLTFFALDEMAGTSFARVILRGNNAIYTF
ncbi:MAG: hypothetical protein GX434_00410 [Peptococcaceae bacterium]|nr:hypothetical protein [Peptococcaceae bacterium]